MIDINLFQTLPHYNINDLVMFFNLDNWDLSSTKCPKCNGSQLIEYFDHSTNSNRYVDCNCYCGYVHDDQKLKDQQHPKLAIGRIAAIKISNTGEVSYQINCYAKYGKMIQEIKGYNKFFSNLPELYCFPCDNYVVCYGVKHDLIFNVLTKFEEEKSNFTIPEYDYWFQNEDKVYAIDRTFISQPCSICHDLNTITSRNGVVIKCPNHSQKREYQKTLISGVISEIFLTVEYDDEYNEFEHMVPGLIVKYNVEAKMNIKDKVLKWNFSLLSGLNVLSRDINEILFLLEENK